MKLTARLIVVIVLACCFTVANAQKAGNKLFKQGQEYQMVQTVPAQKEAIRQFSAAKKAYDSAEMKAMCDNQIKICEKNIANLKGKERKEPKDKTKDKEYKPDASVDYQPDNMVRPVPKKKIPVELTLSEAAVGFKAGGKKNDNHQVTVNCNYDGWTFTAPDWVTVNRNGNVLTLTASANDSGEERSDVLVVECEDAKAELVVYQKYKIIDKFNPFRKKSKN